MIFRILLLPYSLKSRAQSPANRGIALPCISWAKVSVLKCQQIPITKKGGIFRKKLEEVFGEQLASLINGSGHESEANVKPTEDLAQGKTKDQVASVISNIVVETLRISADMLENNSQSTFAEVSIFLCTFYYYLLIVTLARNGFGYGYDDRKQTQPSTQLEPSLKYMPHLY